MNAIARVGVDLAKNALQVHAVDLGWMASRWAAPTTPPNCAYDPASPEPRFSFKRPSSTRTLPSKMTGATALIRPLIFAQMSKTIRPGVETFYHFQERHSAKRNAQLDIVN